MLDKIEIEYEEKFYFIRHLLDYLDSLEYENECIIKINQELNLESNDYLATQVALDNKVKILEKIFENVTQIRSGQCVIIERLLADGLLRVFLEELFTNNKTLIDNVEKFVTEYLMPQQFEDKDDDRQQLANQSYYRYVNAVIQRYLSDIKEDSFEKLLTLLDRGKQKISIEYGQVYTKIDPIDISYAP